MLQLLILGVCRGDSECRFIISLCHMGRCVFSFGAESPHPACPGQPVGTVRLLGRLKWPIDPLGIMTIYYH